MLETACRMHDAEMECVALNRQAVLEGENVFQLERAIALLVNLLTLGIVYQALLLPEKATVAYLEALKIAESLSAKRYVAMSASLLCAVSVLVGRAGCIRA